MTLVHLSIGGQDYLNARGVSLVLLGMHAFFFFDVHWGFHPQRFTCGAGVDWWRLQKSWSYAHRPRAPWVSP